MYKTDCIFKLKLSNGRTVNLFLAGESEVFATVSNGDIKHYKGIPVDKVYYLLQDAWKMADVSIVGITNHLIGDARFWYSQALDLVITLKVIYQRDRPELGDETHEHVWQLELGRPLVDLIDPESDDEEYEEHMRFIMSEILEGLHEHGFYGETPESAYTPTGKMFNRVSIHSKNKRMLVYNIWARDC